MFPQRSLCSSWFPHTSGQSPPGFPLQVGEPSFVLFCFFYPSPDLSLINTFRKKETQIYTKIEKHKAVRTNFSFTNSKFKPHHPCTAGTAKPGLSHKTLPPSGEILNIDSSIFFHGSEIWYIRITALPHLQNLCVYALRSRYPLAVSMTDCKMMSDWIEVRKWVACSFDHWGH